MEKNEAIYLASQLNISLPKTKVVNALWDKCDELGYSIVLEEVMKNYKAVDSCWVVLDAAKNEIARCK